MGILDKFAGAAGMITDPGDFFGARGAADAAATSKALGYETLGMQQDWLNYIKGQYEPYSEAGQDALAQQVDMLGEMKGPNYAAAMDSPLYKQMMDSAGGAMKANAAATGGLRGGSIQRGLADLSQQSMITAANKNYQDSANYFNTLGALSGKGLQGAQGLGSFGGDTLGGMAATMGGIGTAGMNAAAGQQQQAGGILSAAGGLLAAFSDDRLKENINYTGEKTKGGIPVCTWVWNSEAKKLGLTGGSKGVLASDVEKAIPDAVTIDKSGYKKVDYARV